MTNEIKDCNHIKNGNVSPYYCNEYFNKKYCNSIQKEFRSMDLISRQTFFETTTFRSYQNNNNENNSNNNNSQSFRIDCYLPYYGELYRVCVKKYIKSLRIPYLMIKNHHDYMIRKFTQPKTNKDINVDKSNPLKDITFKNFNVLPVHTLYSSEYYYEYSIHKKPKKSKQKIMLCKKFNRRESTKIGKVLSLWKDKSYPKLALGMSGNNKDKSKRNNISIKKKESKDENMADNVIMQNELKRKTKKKMEEQQKHSVGPLKKFITNVQNISKKAETIVNGYQKQIMEDDEVTNDDNFLCMISDADVNVHNFPHIKEAEHWENIEKVMNVNNLMNIKLGGHILQKNVEDVLKDIKVKDTKPVLKDVVDGLYSLKSQIDCGNDDNNDSNDKSDDIAPALLAKMMKTGKSRASLLIDNRDSIITKIEEAATKIMHLKDKGDELVIKQKDMERIEKENIEIQERNKFYMDVLVGKMNKLENEISIWETKYDTLMAQNHMLKDDKTKLTEEINTIKIHAKKKRLNKNLIDKNIQTTTILTINTENDVTKKAAKSVRKMTVFGASIKSPISIKSPML